MVEQANINEHNGQDRRKHVRYKCNMDISTIIRYGADTKERFGASGHVIASVKKRAKVVDLSLGGAQVETDEGIKTGTPVEICIETPYGKNIEGRGRVVWVKKNLNYMVGIAFENLGWLQKFRLKRFIKWLSSIAS